MPQYELMYLLGSNVADNEVPQVSEQVLKFVSEFGGADVRQEQLGKKKLAYPIKKTRNGHYVTVNFAMDTKRINEFEARVHAMSQSIIRYILINIDEHLERSAKDKIAQSKLTHRLDMPEALETPATKPSPAYKAPKTQKVPSAPKEPLVEIDEKALDEKIEAALTEDVTK
jgi:small subunit ribosomal protein S6